MIELPGRPRWCVTDADGTRLFLAIREPSVVLVAGLPQLEVPAPRQLPQLNGGPHAEGDALGGPRQIDHDAADARLLLVRVPLDVAATRRGFFHEPAFAIIPAAIMLIVAVRMGIGAALLGYLLWPIPLIALLGAGYAIVAIRVLG